MRASACALALIAAACERTTTSEPTSSCDAPVGSWLIAGPFPLDTGALRLDRSDIGDPAALFASAGDPVPGTVAVRWRAESADSLGRVDLYSVFRDPKLDDRAAYALTYVRSPEPRTVRLRVESDDDVVIWLNGRRVWRREIARELRSGADTIVLPLTRGENRLLYRVVNRGGGFGLGARLLAISRDPIGDLTSEVSAPARDEARLAIASDTARAPVARPAVTLGPATMAPRADIRALVPGRAPSLAVQLRVCATRWARTRGELSLNVGGSRVAIPRSDVGRAFAMVANADWTTLAREAIDGGAQAEVRAGDQPVTHLTLPLTANALLELLSRPITVGRWLGTVDTTTSAREVELNAEMDSTRRLQLRRIRTDLVVPTALAGLTLEAEIAELGPPYAVTVNNASSAPDSLGRAVLCAPCAEGASLTLAIAPHGVWWDPPRIRVRELGWAEIRDGAEWARYFTGDSSIAAPDSATAQRLLRDALDPFETRVSRDDRRVDRAARAGEHTHPSRHDRHCWPLAH